MAYETDSIVITCILQMRKLILPEIAQLESGGAGHSTQTFWP